jgi:hypothetical protein
MRPSGPAGAALTKRRNSEHGGFAWMPVGLCFVEFSLVEQRYRAVMEVLAGIELRHHRLPLAGVAS